MRIVPLKEFITIGISVVGAFAGTLQLLDWCLTTRQKTTINDKMLRLWVWLADHSSDRFITYIWSARFQFIIATIVMTIFAVIFLAVTAGELSELHDSPLSHRIFFGVGLAAIGVGTGLFFYYVIHRRVSRKIAEAKSVRAFAWRMLQLGLLFGIPTFIILNLDKMHLFYTDNNLVIYAVTTVACLCIPILLEAMILLILLGLALYWIPVAWLCSRFVKVTALILERALSQEKNGLAGLAAVCLAIVAILKSF